MGILVAEKNRLSRAAPEVRPSIEAHIDSEASLTIWTPTCDRGYSVVCMA